MATFKERLQALLSGTGFAVLLTREGDGINVEYTRPHADNGIISLDATIPIYNATPGAILKAAEKLDERIGDAIRIVDGSL